MSDEEKSDDESYELPDLFDDDELADIASQAMLHADEVKDDRPEEALAMLDFAKVALAARAAVRESFKMEDVFERTARLLGIDAAFLKGGIGGFLRTAPAAIVDAVEDVLRSNGVQAPDWLWEEFARAREYRKAQEEDDGRNGLKAVPYEPPPDDGGNQGGI